LKLAGLNTANPTDERGLSRRASPRPQVKVRDGKFSTVDLSQGQRKRLALLTAYLEDRPFYLFDEWLPTRPQFKEIFYRQILPT